jgi:hypothetical protein
MAYEQKDMTFSAFKNKRKEKKEHADLTGTMLIEGKEYWVNIWKKTDKNKDTWLSGSIRPKVKNETKEAPPSRQAQKEAWDESSEIPF